MSTEGNEAVVRRLLDVWEAGDVDLIDELLAPDYVNHSPASPQQPTGRERRGVSRRNVVGSKVMA